MKKYIPKTFLENFGLGLTIAYSVIWPLEMGLTLTQVAVIQSCMFITSILFEVPTGILADNFGKKYSLILGLFFNVLGFITISLGHSFLTFLLGGILVGVSRSFSSGAEEAYINEVFSEDDEKKYKKNYSSMAITDEIAIFFGSIMASLVAVKFSLQSIYWFASISILLSLIYLLVFLPKDTIGKGELGVFIKNDPRKIREEISKYKNFLLIFISLSILLESARVIWQPQLLNTGWSLNSLGFLFAGLRVFSVLGSYVAKKLHISSLKSIYISSLAGGLFLVLFAIGTKFLSFFAIGLYLFMENVFQLHQSNYLLRIAIVKHAKSTFLSAANLFRNIQLAITGPIIIFLVANIGIYMSMIILFVIKTVSVIALHKQQGKINTGDVGS